MELQLKSIKQCDSEYKSVLVLRNEVLRQPLGLNLFEEDLTDDAANEVLIAIDIADNTIAACLMLKDVGNGTFKLRQMAVLPFYQNKKVGKKMVAYAEGFAKEKGITQIELHARAHAADFYAKIGYSKIGESFMEVGIQHFKMIKELA